MTFSDHLIHDYSDPRFQSAFRLYFDELGISVRDWEGLFREMGQDETLAYLRLAADEQVIGFIQFVPVTLENWFFEERAGFIREFWIAPALRGRGHGSDLLRLTEAYFLSHGLPRSILTSDTAPAFYLHRGYRAAAGFSAKNHDPVFWKELS